MLNSDPQNESRIQFLAKLSGPPWEPLATNKKRVMAIHRAAKPWAKQKNGEVLMTLKKPTVNECSLLLKVAHQHGGVEYVRDMYVLSCL